MKDVNFIQKKTIVIFYLCTMCFFSLQTRLSSQEYFPVVEIQRGYLLGASDKKGGFHKPEDIFDLLTGKENYKLFIYDKQIGNATGGMPEYGVYPCTETLTLSIATDRAFDETMFAIAGGAWDPLPKKITKQAPNNAIYNKILKDYLTKLGITSPIASIDELYRCDIEGDGVDEVILVANNFRNPMFSVTKGDYSVVIIRKVISGVVEHIPVIQQIVKQTDEGGIPETASFGALLDLTGDGVCEIIIHLKYYEGEATVTFQIEGKTVKMLSSVGCGV